MNRIQFFVLTGLSSLVALLLAGHIALDYQVGKAQNTVLHVRQLISQGEVASNGLQRLGSLIGQEGQRTGDQALKEMLTRQQLNYIPATNATETPAAPPSASNR
jgi:hypothetical protein